MTTVRTQVSARGFTESEVRHGIPHAEKFLDARDWLTKTEIVWDKRRQCLVITVEREGMNPAVFRDDQDHSPMRESAFRDGGANWDEISDCICACFRQNANITIKVDKSVIVHSDRKTKGNKNGQNRNPRRKSLRRP